MLNWKPWQQIAFLGYLFLLNVIVLGSFAYVLFSHDFRGLLHPPRTSVAVVPPLISLTPTFTLSPTNPVLSQAGTATLRPTENLATSIPPRHIPPVPLPTQDDAANSQMSPTASPEPTRTPSSTLTPIGARATPSKQIPTTTNTPTPSSTATNTPRPTPTPSSTATNTPRPTPTPSSTATHTPRPTPTPSSTATNTPRPTPTPSSTATNTPRPTPTPSSTATNTPRPTPAPSSTATNTPRPTPAPSNTATNTPRPMPSPSSTATLSVEPAVTRIALAALPAGDTLKNAPLNRSAQPNSAIAGFMDATPLTNDSIALSWQPGEQTQQYRLYSDMGSGYGVYIYKARTTQSAFIDMMLRAGMAYRYRLTRLADSQEMVLGQIDTATFTRPLTPTVTLSGPLTASVSSVTPAPTALPPDAILLGLLSDNNFTDDFQTLTIVGEVRNDSSLDVGQVAVAITFYNTSGAVIGKTNGTTVLEVIPPGAVSPFLVTLTRPAGMTSYSLHAVARPASPPHRAQLTVVEMKHYEDSAGFLHIQGLLENAGKVRAKRAKVVAVIYGRDGRIINAAFTYVNPPTLDPDKRATYDVIFTYYPKYMTQIVIPFEE